jgi:hypothetical protein
MAPRAARIRETRQLLSENLKEAITEPAQKEDNIIMNRKEVK